MLRLLMAADDKHGAGSVGEHVLGRAAQQQAADGALPAGADDNQVNTIGQDRADNLIAGMP